MRTLDLLNKVVKLGFDREKALADIDASLDEIIGAENRKPIAEEEIRMADGNMLRVGETYRFADLWQSETGDEEELLESGCCWVAYDEDNMPMVADFEIIEKDEENPIYTLVRVTDIR